MKKTLNTKSTSSETIIGLVFNYQEEPIPQEETRSILEKKGIHCGLRAGPHFVFVKNQDLCRIKKILPPDYCLVDDEVTELEYSDIEEICKKDKSLDDNDCE